MLIDKSKVIKLLKSKIPSEYKDGLTYDEYYYDIDSTRNLIDALIKEVENI